MSDLLRLLSAHRRSINPLYPPPPTPEPTDGHDYAKNFGEQVMPSEAANLDIPGTQYKSPFDDSFGYQKPQPKPAAPYIGQRFGRH